MENAEVTLKCDTSTPEAFAFGLEGRTLEGVSHSVRPGMSLKRECRGGTQASAERTWLAEEVNEYGSGKKLPSLPEFVNTALVWCQELKAKWEGSGLARLPAVALPDAEAGEPLAEEKVQNPWPAF